MNDTHSDKLLASYALFKGLFDKGKDIYGVIAEYLKKTVSEKGLYNFTLDEITQILNREYEFNIPNAVVKTSLNRIENLTKKERPILLIILMILLQQILMNLNKIIEIEMIASFKV